MLVELVKNATTERIGACDIPIPLPVVMKIALLSERLYCCNLCYVPKATMESPTLKKSVSGVHTIVMEHSPLV